MFNFSWKSRLLNNPYEGVAANGLSNLKSPLIGSSMSDMTAPSTCSLADTALVSEVAQLVVSALNLEISAAERSRRTMTRG